jgi:hypothetical protein
MGVRIKSEHDDVRCVVTVYTVYEPPGGNEADVAVRAEKIAFIKDGFSWLALFVPVLWLIFQRMWLELIAYIAIIASVSWAFGAEGPGRQIGGWVVLGFTLLFAFEANDLRGWALRRRGYQFAGVAAGRDRYAAERSFFEGWLPQQRRAMPPVPPAQKSSAPKAAKPPRGGDGDEVIGLFPQA